MTPAVAAPAHACSRPPPPAPRGLLAAGAAVAAVAVGGYLAALAAHPLAVTLKGFDLQVYLGGAQQALRHPGALYSWSYDGHPGIQFTYTPFAALLFAAGLAVPLRGLTAAATVVSVLALAATVGTAFRALGWRGTPRLGATLLVAGLALWTEPVQQTFWYGQINLLLMAAIVIDLCLPERSRAKGVLIGLAAGFKLTPAIFIAYLFCTRRYQAGFTSIGAFCVTIAGCFLVLPSESRQYWGGLFFDSSRVGAVDFVGDQSLHGWITRMFDGGAAAQPVWFAAAAVVGVVGLLLATWQYRAGNELLSILVTAVTGLLVSPISWSHHWVWIVLALVLVADQAWRRARVRDIVLAVGLFALFAAWFERVVGSGSGLVPMGLIWRVPYNNNLEYTWRGVQLIQGDMYTYLGLLFLLCLGVSWARSRGGWSWALAKKK